MLHMLHAECLTVDPDHFNRNTEALPQAHRKKPLPHGHPKPSRPAETTWLRFQAAETKASLRRPHVPHGVMVLAILLGSAPASEWPNRPLEASPLELFQAGWCTLQQKRLLGLVDFRAVSGRLQHDTPCGMPGNRVAQVRKLGTTHCLRENLLYVPDSHPRVDPS